MHDGTVAYVGRIWKSPRDRSRCIQASLRSYNGNVYLDVRMLELRGGMMLPTDKGITVSAKKLGEFSKLIGDAFRKAAQIGEAK